MKPAGESTLEARGDPFSIAILKPGLVNAIELADLKNLNESAAEARFSDRLSVILVTTYSG